MKRLNPQTDKGTIRHPGQKAFLLSLLCHLLFIRIFVFTFSIKPATPQPFFVFLGSILERQDLNSAPNKATAQKDPTRLRIPVQFQSSVFEPSCNLEFTKPISQNNQQISKPSAVPLLEGPTPESHPQKSLTEKLGIEATVPRRAPLELYLK